MTGLTHPKAGTVYACPGCDETGGRLYQREDSRVSCYGCDSTWAMNEMVERQDESGYHTPSEANARGGRKGGSQHSDEHMRRIAKLGGRTELYEVDECKFAILRVARVVGDSPTRREYEQYKLDGDPALSVIRDRFGSWNQAKEDIGLQPNPPGRPPKLATESD